MRETGKDSGKRPQTAARRRNAYPRSLRFVGGYTDPLTYKGVEELRMLVEQQIEDLGGWQGVQETLAAELWVHGLNWVGCACPGCQPGGGVRGGGHLVLRRGVLVCKACRTTVYPSERFQVDQPLELLVAGRSFRTTCHRSEKRVNFLLREHHGQLRQRMLHNRSGLLSACYLLYERTHEEVYAERCAEIMVGLATKPQGLVLKKLAFGGPGDRFENVSGAWQEIAGFDFHAKPAVERYWILAFNAVRDCEGVWKRFGDPARLKAKVRQSLIDRHEY